MGQVFGFGEDFPSKTMTQKEKQVAFLKEHEQEIVDFVKSQNPKVESVQIDWNDVRWIKGGGMFKTTESINIFGGFNNNKDTSFRVDIELIDGQIDMTKMGLGQDLRMGGELFE